MLNVGQEGAGGWTQAAAGHIPMACSPSGWQMAGTAAMYTDGAGAGCTGAAQGLTHAVPAALPAQCGGGSGAAAAAACPARAAELGPTIHARNQQSLPGGRHGLAPALEARDVGIVVLGELAQVLEVGHGCKLDRAAPSGLWAGKAHPAPFTGPAARLAQRLHAPANVAACKGLPLFGSLISTVRGSAAHYQHTARSIEAARCLLSADGLDGSGAGGGCAKHSWPRGQQKHADMQRARSVCHASVRLTVLPWWSVNGGSGGGLGWVRSGNSKGHTASIHLWSPALGYGSLAMIAVAALCRPS